MCTVWTMHWRLLVTPCSWATATHSRQRCAQHVVADCCGSLQPGCMVRVFWSCEGPSCPIMECMRMEGGHGTEHSWGASLQVLLWWCGTVCCCYLFSEQVGARVVAKAYPEEKVS